MQEYAHAWPLPKAEVHFNDAQPFVPVSWEPGAPHGTRQSPRYPISLLKVCKYCQNLTQTFDYLLLNSDLRSQFTKLVILWVFRTVKIVYQ